MKKLFILGLIVAGGYFFVTKTDKGERIRSFFRGKERVVEYVSTPQRVPPVIKPTNNDEEIKEILRLTRIIYELEQSINEMNASFGIIQDRSEHTDPGEKNSSRLLANLENIQQKMENDKSRIYELRQQLKEYKSKNDDVADIKEYYEKMLDEKNAQLNEMASGLASLQQEINLKEKTIESQYQTIENQTTTIQSQKQEISRLSKKYLILYSRKETHIEEVNSDEIDIQVKSKRMEIVSDHPQETYSISEGDNNSTLRITDGKSFWNGNNYLIVKIRGASL